ncbi:hypothetical protein SeMB42_g02304 [Synchytrium endobioticum]|uniref:Uncharacterized protein n=1 Tax=Synchytrium endobioticum TaxID=286115 RepID=A0A507DFD6_9FUNG|nr:hypothetical protein SeLEV6574_g05320 [Synchytrium endobioticum]TPX50313.1 hypothetical protein SeMB42_g02304 [Synchytrium endobioticum]
MITLASNSSSNFMESPKTVATSNRLTDTVSLSLSSFIFGLLVAWTLHLIARSCFLLRDNGWKPIFILNVLQTFMMLLKTLFAATYAITDDLPCYPRGMLTSAPVSLANEMVFIILLLTLLVFTPYKRFCCGVFIITLSAHLGVTLAGVLTAVRGRNSDNRCFDLYGPFFKHQYTLEGFLELFTLVMLFDGLRRQTRGATFLSRTESILNEIKSNSELRVFLVMVVIAIKILHSWLSNGGFTIGVYNSLTFTHALDIARSHVCCWSLASLKKRLQAKQSTDNSNHTLKRHASAPFAKMMSMVDIGPTTHSASDLKSLAPSPSRTEMSRPDSIRVD